LIPAFDVESFSLSRKLWEPKTMPTIVTGSINVDGPRIALNISLGNAPNANQSAMISCLVDTGASRTAINPAVLASLGLVPLAGPKASVVTAGGTLLAAEFQASIWTVGANPSCLVANLRVVGVAPFGCSALIGQDVLRLCELLHDGPGNTVSLTFP
jgi:hypothetical protein